MAVNFSCAGRVVLDFAHAMPSGLRKLKATTPRNSMAQRDTTHRRGITLKVYLGSHSGYLDCNGILIGELGYGWLAKVASRYLGASLSGIH